MSFPLRQPASSDATSRGSHQPVDLQKPVAVMAGRKVRQQLTVSYWPGADPQPEPEPKHESESGLKNLFFTGRAYFRDDI